jgi:shikimate dehydrogenase
MERTWSARAASVLRSAAWSHPGLGAFITVSSQSLQPILALMGCPVGGNPIQYMMEKAFARHELDWRYVSLEIAHDDLPDAVRGMKVMGFVGGNCAMPYKETIGPLLDRLGRTAEWTGVVNLIRRENDELVGENTEGTALIESLGGSGELTGRRAVVLGAGRMAKVVAVELAAAGVAAIMVVDRTEPRAAELAKLVTEKTGIAASSALWDTDYRVAPETDLLIHATSATQGNPDAQIALAVDSLEARLTVVDTTIDPPGTWLLEQARSRGCTAIDGVAIFTNQVVLNFRTWTGVEPDRAVLREAIEEFLEL